MFRDVVPGQQSRLTLVDHTETYGRHILRKITRKLTVSRCVDLGCGSGDDLLLVKSNHPDSDLIGVDVGGWNKDKLASQGIVPLVLNIEQDSLPFEDETVDLIIANQVLEHTKELFWINHEIFRSLKVGGCLYLGVPNVLSLHNRILGLFGIHPTCAKIISAHVRAFSKRDTLLFYRAIARDFMELEDFYGAQFYPFPRTMARPLAFLLPSLAFSIFFLIRKTSRYDGEFIRWPASAELETNFYLGSETGSNAS
jgi:SAM-dependent methyltransferase